MVRIIVSAMLQVGSGKMSLVALEKLIVEKPTMRPVLALVPPHGLKLVEVGYPEALFLKENAS